MAIIGAAFAIYAAKLAISYDRKKVDETTDREWRRSLGAVLGAVTYSQNVVISKREFGRISKQFPEDVYPAVLLEATPLENVTINNLKEMPANVSMRSFYLAFSMQFANNMAITNLGRQLAFEDRERLRNGFLQHLQRTLLCSDIVHFHLRYLIGAPKDEWKEEDFDIITWDLLGPLSKNRKVSKEEAETLMKELKINIIPDDGSKIMVSGMPQDD